MSGGRRALIVGMGGLGCPASLGLARAGVEHLTLIDPDVVELSNLHRQPWHRTSDLGRPKVTSAAEKLRAAFPSLQLEALQAHLDSSNAIELFRDHDVVIDATDGTGTKFLLNDAAVRVGVPLIYGGVLQLEGQLMRIRPGGPCLRCLFETPPDADAVPTCAQAGVLGPLAGLIGALQAVMALDESPGEPGFGHLAVINARTLVERRVRLRRRADCTCATPDRIKLTDPKAPGC